MGRLNLILFSKMGGGGGGGGPALMVVQSKLLPLTASCLSPLWVSMPPRACEKVVSDLGLGSVFFSLGTPVSSTSSNWLITTQPQYGRKSDEKWNFKFQIPNLPKWEGMVTWGRHYEEDSNGFHNNTGFFLDVVRIITIQVFLSVYIGKSF